jgi:hypothetical protein
MIPSARRGKERGRGMGGAARRGRASLSWIRSVARWGVSHAMIARGLEGCCGGAGSRGRSSACVSARRSRVCTSPSSTDSRGERFFRYGGVATPTMRPGHARAARRWIASLGEGLEKGMCSRPEARPADRDMHLCAFRPGPREVKRLRTYTTVIQTSPPRETTGARAVAAVLSPTIEAAAAGTAQLQRAGPSVGGSRTNPPERTLVPDAEPQFRPQIRLKAPTPLVRRQTT